MSTTSSIQDIIDKILAATNTVAAVIELVEEAKDIIQGLSSDDQVALQKAVADLQEKNDILYQITQAKLRG